MFLAYAATIGALLRRHIRHGTAHPAMVGDLVETIERGSRPARRAGGSRWPSR